MNLKDLGSHQTEIEKSNGVTVFFSYNTPVAAHIPGKGFVKTSEFYSKTTSKHINQWLKANGSGNAETVDQDFINNLV